VSKSLMTLIVIKDNNDDLGAAQMVAVALCAAGVTQPYPGGLPFRAVDEYGGSIEIKCCKEEFRRAKAAFMAVGFTVLTAV
jgi:hypothetical protein